MPAATPNPLFPLLKARFEAHLPRHEGLAWAAVQDRLQDRLLDRADALRTLAAMAATGREPDVIAVDVASGPPRGAGFPRPAARMSRRARHTTPDTPRLNRRP
ncbi:MAG: DUF4256 domain-containing protein [Rubrivivax sp.]|nr:DUF4256 domain-containing protein [Rubrivivax sp.]